MEQKNVDYPFRFDLCTCCNTAVALPSKEWLKFIVAVSIEHAKFSEGTSNINLWFRAESMFIPDLCRLKIKHFSCSNLIPVALISPSTKLVLGQIYSGPPLPLVQYKLPVELGLRIHYLDPSRITLQATFCCVQNWAFRYKTQLEDMNAEVQRYNLNDSLYVSH